MPLCQIKDVNYFCIDVCITSVKSLVGNGHELSSCSFIGVFSYDNALFSVSTNADDTLMTYRFMCSYTGIFSFY